ncbi:MAG: hypothetical protein SFX18_13970 [Pirellulales bacterium]|nr:hypothetical protein [Pirellulales bacterium]
MFTSLRAALMVALAMVAGLGLGATSALANDPVQKYALLDPSTGTPAYTSLKLKAQFRVENFFLPAFGNFTAVRLVSIPAPDSPLNALGLQPGDVITRLDGIRTDNLAQLENHYSWTQVRYIKTGTQQVLIGNIYINPVAPPFPGPGPFIPGGNAP